MLYTLRTAPCFLSPLLQSFDDPQRSLLADIANISVDANDPAWAQAVLPVWSGGLGIRSASQLAPSAFLASAAGSSELTHRILPPGLQGAPCPSHEVALALWSSGHEEPPPSTPVFLPSEVLGFSQSDIGIKEPPGDCSGCTRTGAPACCSCKGVGSLAAGPSCIIVGPAHGQGGGPGGLGS